ncbi:transcriptional regulator family: Fungal Specific TF [Trichoderma aggressivum f. europaeum]|uniref:Transcriptional regulator family: Fungal Specific TF n=1 Tax=Trichoderma aggressivum f. europaeum TaxID=173218 RepID=A0AAE1JCH8_9HYPO|nr:transcriptional regulator family: Fungal Specific TF [Trichoderma aggressivum f. europaeum]
MGTFALRTGSPQDPTLYDDKPPVTDSEAADYYQLDLCRHSLWLLFSVNGLMKYIVMNQHSTSRADPRHARRVSCIICAKGKRRCSRQIPSCTRCAEKGFVCRYPAPRISYVPPIELVFSSDGPPTVYQDLRGSAGNSASSGASSATANGRYHEQLLLDSTNENRNHLAQDSTSFLTESRSATTGDEPILAPHLSNPWFLSPSSWVITDNTDSVRPRGCLNEEALRQFPDHAMAWLKQWSVKGHCPFIHLNQQKTFNGFPDCLQDAYTVTAAYTNSTPATKQLALRILQSRAAQLVSTFKDARSLEDLIYGPMTALSRLQALLVYTIIGLFDGDIRARGQAESNLDILTTWSTELWERAVLDISQSRAAEDNPSTDINDLLATERCKKVGTAQEAMDAAAPTSTDPTISTTKYDYMGLIMDGTIYSAWQSWIFAESIRRTYLTVGITRSVFRVLQKGWSDCPGGIIFTAANGLWDASDPHTWMKRISSSGFLPVRHTDMGNLVDQTDRSKVDEFSHTIVIISFGLERYAQWGADSNEQESVSADSQRRL